MRADWPELPGQRRPGHTGWLLLTSFPREPGFAKKRASPIRRGVGRGAQNLGTPEPSLGRAGAQLPQGRRTPLSPGREEAERLTPAPRLSVGCEAPLS